MIQERNFCIGPWSEIRILPDGRLNWCHIADYKSSADWIQNTDLDQYFQSASVDFVRQQLLSGSDVSQCKNCYSDEQKGNISFRQRRNLQTAIFPGQHFKKSLKESPFNQRFNNPQIKPYFYNIVLGNLCNLACMMCNEDFSSRLAVDFKRINIQHGAGAAAFQDWTQDQEVWSKFVKHIDSNSDIVCLHFQGGEPLIHRRFVEFIDHCIQTGHTDFHLTMVTNGTVYSAELIDKFAQFRSCQIEISIETASGVNDYIRYPSDTQKVLNNIQSFLSHRTSQLDVVIRTVPQLLSVADYTSILNFCLDHHVVIDSNLVNNPTFLKPAVWPVSVIEEISKELEEFKSKLNVQSAPMINLRNNQQIERNISQNIDLVLRSLREPLADKDVLQKKAKEYIQKLDNLRNINVLDFCPLVARL